MILIDNIRVEFDNRVILDGISGAIEKGQFIGLLGNNGSGKSTLLSCMYGNHNKYNGTIHYGMDLLQDLDRLSIAKYTAIVLSQRMQIPNMRVGDVLATSRYPHFDWMRNRQVGFDQQLEHWIELAEITGLENRLIDSLSDGEFQKVMLARAYSQETPFLIMDEPSCFLDVLQKRKLFDYLLTASKNDKGIIIATHDVHEAIEFCTDLWIIDGGKLIKFKNGENELMVQLNRIFATKF